MNDGDVDGASPLHYAARYKRIRLREPGASPTSEASKLERQVTTMVYCYQDMIPLNK